MRNRWSLSLMLGMLLLATATTLSAEEKAEDIAKKTVEHHFKLIKEKNVDEAMKIVDVPFYWIGSPKPFPIKDKKDLRDNWHGFLTESPGLEKVEFTIKETVTLDKYVDSDGKKLSADEEKDLGKLLGSEHRIFRVRMKFGQQDATVLIGIRVKDKKGTVVGLFQ